MRSRTSTIGGAGYAPDGTSCVEPRCIRYICRDSLQRPLVPSGSATVWLRRSVLPAVLLAAVIAAAGCGSSTSTSTSSVTTGPTPAKCQITLTVSSNIVAGGGTGSISVGAQPECEWSVSTQASWISDLSPASGQGNGTIDFRAASNAASSAREGEIVVNDNRVRVMQEAAPCHFSITPGEQTFSSTDGDGSVAVAARTDAHGRQGATRRLSPSPLARVGAATALSSSSCRRTRATRARVR